MASPGAARAERPLYTPQAGGAVLHERGGAGGGGPGGPGGGEPGPPRVGTRPWPYMSMAGRQSFGGRAGIAAARGPGGPSLGVSEGAAGCRMAFPVPSCLSRQRCCLCTLPGAAEQNRGRGAWRGLAHGGGGLP